MNTNTNVTTVSGKNFCHLHLHDCFSKDSPMRIEEAIAKIKADGNTAIAVTNHGNVEGIFRLDAAARAANIHPIFGCEFYVAPASRYDRNPKEHYHHLVLLVKDSTGYKNLCQLATRAYTEGFYYKPRIDEELLEQYHEGLICLSACVAGKIPQAIIHERWDIAEQTVQKYLSWFGEDFYLEVQNHGIPDEFKMIQGIEDIAARYGIKIVATNDAHYLDREDAEIHDVFLAMRSDAQVTDEKRFRFVNDQFWVKTTAEMSALFPNHPEYLTNTMEIEQKCQFQISYKGDSGYKLPVFNTENISNKEMFTNICKQGLQERYENADAETLAHAQEQLSHELSVIEDTGFVDYFLIVQDFINWAKRQGIPVGPGRGSGAGSIAAYCSKITNIDPLRFGLFFERFLNKERVSMPDFDIDFDIERRSEVIRYVQEKYGKDRVCQILTFQTYGPNQVLKDIGKAFGVPYATTSAWTKPITAEDKHLQDVMKHPDFKQMYDSDQMLQKVFRIALRIEGNPKSESKHAAGVLICDKPVVEYAALRTPDKNSEDDLPIIQAVMSEVEQLGLVKFDFLGLRNLTVIDKAIKAIKENHGIDINIDDIPEEPEVFKMMAEEKTVDIFQLESEGMRKTLKDLQPTSIEDLTALISLYRPGPMDSIPQYINNKHNPGAIVYDDPRLKPILEVTYGCLVYQEQVMKLFQVLAGYSLGQADIVRRAISKKKESVLEEEKHNFIYGKKDGQGNVIVPGALANRVPENVAKKIMDEVTSFAAYAFNKSHAASYAVIAYQTAWLKYHYPAEFLAANLNSYLKSSQKMIEDVQNIAGEGYKILPPSVNVSGIGFVADGDSIRYGMAGIKNVGESIVDLIINERQKRLFSSFYDFIVRMSSCNLNKRTYEALIKAGAFDWTGETRQTMLNGYEKLITAAKNSGTDGQLTILSMIPDGDQYLAPQMEKFEEYPTEVSLGFEKEVTGLFMSGHPMATHKKYLPRTKAIYPSELKNNTSRTVCVAGCLTGVQIKKSKKGTQFMNAVLEDENSSVKCVAFQKTLEDYGSLLTESRCVVIKGRMDENSLQIQSVFAIPDDSQEGAIVSNFVSAVGPPAKVAATVNQEKVTAVKEPEVARANKPKRGLYFRCTREQALKILTLAKAIKGNVPIFLQTKDKDGNDYLYSNPNLQVSMADSAEIHAMFDEVGPGNVWIELPTMTE